MENSIHDRVSHFAKQTDLALRSKVPLEERFLPPMFSPAPRKYLTTPADEVKIQAPPALPNPINVSIVAVLLPLIGAGLTVILSMIVGTGSNYIFITVPLSILSASWGIYQYSTLMRKYKAQVQQRKDLYKTYVDNIVHQLEDYREQQLSSSLVPNPSPEECLYRVMRKDTDLRLWERSISDEDFLNLRIGVGSIDAAFKINFPEFSPVLPIDELFLYAKEQCEKYSKISDAAVTVDIRHLGSVGIVGQSTKIEALTYSLLIQLATHHSPDQVKIALFAAEAEQKKWVWARWLNHIWDDEYNTRYLSLQRDAAKLLLEATIQELKRRQARQSDAVTGNIAAPAFVLVFTDSHLFRNPEDEFLTSVLNLILTEGPKLGIYSIFLVEKSADVPKRCQAIVDLSLMPQSKMSKGNSIAGPHLVLVGPPRVEQDFIPDQIDNTFAETFARISASIKFQRIASATRLPNSVALLDLLDVIRIEELDLATRWHNSRPEYSLSIPIGSLGGKNIQLLDLHENGEGPHGLVAGTTRSGKTVFLSSMIAILAAHFHPDYVSFLAIDYKGGDMVRDFVNRKENSDAEPILPHLLGVLTNLEPRIMSRAIQGLREELRVRQKIFNAEGVGNISGYHEKYRLGKVSEKHAVPRLIIVVDEFAELVRDQPEFMQELVSISRVGGSLGIHLILATQNPAGIVNDQIWGNARFRICFRFGRAEDSKAVLKRPEASYIDARGRAYLQVGENEIFELFQSAWGGASYIPNSRLEDNDSISIIEIDGTQKQQLRLSKPTQESPRQLLVMAQQMRAVASKLKITRLPNPWLAPLPKEIMLSSLRKGRCFSKDGPQDWISSKSTEFEPLIGRVDFPAQREQSDLRLTFSSTKGNLAIFGVVAEEKSAFLQTLILSLSQDVPPNKLNFYLLDFAGRNLSVFQNLPHLSAIAFPNQADRIIQILKHLLRVIDHRKSIKAKNALYPIAFLIIDNLAELVGAYPDEFDKILKICEQGPNAGIYVTVTVPDVNKYSSKLSSYFSQAITFQLNDPSEYSQAVGRTGGLVPEREVFGRGLIKNTPPLEFQTAKASEHVGDEDKQLILRDHVQTLADRWETLKGDSQYLEPVPETVPLEKILISADEYSLNTENALEVPLGISVETAEPWKPSILQSPYNLILGTPSSGKTNLIKTWLLALSECYPASRLQIYLLTLGLPTLRDIYELPQVQYAETPEKCSQLIKDIKSVVDSRVGLYSENNARIDEATILQNHPAIIVVIDDIDDFWSTDPQISKELITTLKKGVGVRMLASLVSSKVNDSNDLLKLLKNNQTGFVLGSTDYDALSVLKVRIPSMANLPLPAGRAIYGRRGQWEFIQLASCLHGELSLQDWVAKIRSKSDTKRLQV